MVSSKTQKEIDESSEIEAMKKVEAVLFISGRFLNMQELISLSDLNPLIIREVLDRLKEKYEKGESALEIIERNELWKMDVSQEYTGITNKLATGNAEFTKAEQETLALIAFKQPMKQSVLIKIRGNKAYDHVKSFADLNLIKKQKSGHTNILTLSDEFYDYFNVSEKEGENILKVKENSEDGESKNSKEESPEQ